MREKDICKRYFRGPVVRTWRLIECGDKGKVGKSKMAPIYLFFYSGIDGGALY